MYCPAADLNQTDEYEFLNLEGFVIYTCLIIKSGNNWLVGFEFWSIDEVVGQSLPPEPEETNKYQRLI